MRHTDPTTKCYKPSRNVSVTKETFFRWLAQHSLFSTTEFVMGLDAKLPQESALSLFSYTLPNRLHGFA